jgi:L-ribulose-5-phosphate 3-epimerase
MHLGFSTNSIGDIDPLAVLPILRDLGYTSLALTLDRHTLDPFAADLPARLAAWRDGLASAGLRCVIETGARYLLDPVRKHEPTLVAADPAGRARRVEFLMKAIDIAGELAADCVSLWSGVVRDAASADVAWTRLVTSLAPVLDHAAARGVVLGFEPEPDMLIDTVARCTELHERAGRPEQMRLTVDIGHLECMGERPPAAHLAAWHGRIVNVHIDDMFACRHEHLPLGTGDVDLAATLAALTAAGFSGGLHVELPRQAHRWFDTARESAAFLRRLLELGSTSLEDRIDSSCHHV